MWVYPEIRFLADQVGYYARRTPAKQALSFEGQYYDYATLEAESNQVANALIGNVVASQDRVVYLGKNCADFFCRTVWHGKNWGLFCAFELAAYRL